ncbi:hypothetical protein B2G69_07340 [Methylorubrum zatmanii]|nr:hypothetical protein [Methylorubrum zatmanii]ARO53983.1 hypothetical protein B2G69_07340 [Methylorubrum zatmanii]
MIRWSLQHGRPMFSYDRSEASDPADDLVFDDEATFAPDLSGGVHPVAAAAEAKRDSATRSREWRARERDRAIVDAVLVDAMVSAQQHVRLLRKRQGGPDDAPPPAVYMRPVLLLAYRELRLKGWSKEKATEALAARTMPKRVPLPPL